MALLEWLMAVLRLVGWASGRPASGEQADKRLHVSAPAYMPRQPNKGCHQLLPHLRSRLLQVQAWAALAVGGLLSFNLLLPSDEPNIARLMGWVPAW